MGRSNKVLQMGIAGKIESLIASGIITSKDISNKLKSEGFDISQPTISRWLREQKENRRETTQQLVRDHVEKSVPADLDALDEMEVQCLQWARETNDEFAHRLAGRRIADSLEDWASSLRSAEAARFEDPEKAEDARAATIKLIMNQCITWIADDLAMQKARLSAMRMASIIIDLKLKHAIGGEGASNIWIGGADPTDNPGQPAGQQTAPRVLTFPGEQEGSCEAH